MHDDTASGDTASGRPTATRRARRKGERGIAIAMVGLLLVPMLIFAAFGVDLASWYARISEIQRAADAAALAGAVWMPEFGTASLRAEESLRSNGFVHGSDGIQVLIEQGASTASLRVTLTDTDADRHFSGIFMDGPARLSRYAEAEYNLPLPLGSPLNYFGGDYTRVPDPPPSFSYTVQWPVDVTTRAPFDNAAAVPVGGVSDPVRPTHLDCHVTNDSDLQGRWAGSPPTYRATQFGSGPVCGWAVSPGTITGTPSAVPPPDYWVRPPTNIGASGCRVRTNGSGSGALLGRWLPPSGDPRPRFSLSGGSTSLPMCTWTPVTATDASLFTPLGGTSFLQTVTPQNQPCRVGYLAADGYWPAFGNWTAGLPAFAGQADTAGNRLCTWSAQITDTTTDAGPAIDPSRSPGFWAAIEGPQVRAYQGDIYSTRCYNTGTGCTVVDNAQYQALTNINRGTWFVVEIPTGLSGNVDLNVFDAAYNPGSTDTLAGDRSLDSPGSGCTSFTTQFQVYEQTNPLDFSVRAPEQWTVGETPDPAAGVGGCNWAVGNPSELRGAWRTLCTLTGVQEGEKYLINVQTTGTTGTGVNGYALEAVANGSHTGIQPAMYAYSHMTMQNNNTCDNDGSTPTPPCPPPDATFYLAEVGPQYAGKTLVLDLWDAGDVSGSAQMTPMMPSTSSPRPVVPVPASSCSFTATSSPNGRISGITGTEYLTPTAPDGGTECMIQTATGGTGRFNGEWLRIRIQIPTTYSCTLGVNPEITSGSCWWGIRYHFTASANDVTTWAARIEGNPLQLTE